MMIPHIRSAIIVLVMCCAAPLTNAHDTPGGMFRFLVPQLDDPVGAAKFLSDEIAALDERLAVLELELAQQESAYQAKVDQTIPRLRFYEIYAGSAIGALLTAAQSPIDVIASMELLERMGKEDLATLTWLEEVRRYLEKKEASLRRYRSLLQTFQEAVEARRHLLANVPAEWDLRAANEYVASSVVDVWNGSIRDHVIVPYFTELGRELSPGLTGEQGLLRRVNSNSWRVTEGAINGVVEESDFIREPKFHIRADHIYFSGRAEVQTNGRSITSYDLVAVGWLDRVARSAVQYRLDAIFIDGVPIDIYDPQLRIPIILGQFLRLELSSLISDGQTLGVEHHNGYLVFRVL